MTLRILELQPWVLTPKLCFLGFDNFVADEDMDYEEVSTNDYINDFVAANCGAGCQMQMALVMMLFLDAETSWKKG